MRFGEWTGGKRSARNGDPPVMTAHHLGPFCGERLPLTAHSPYA